MKLDKRHAMVVLSGGQDSTTCLGWAIDKYKRVSAVTFNYGQRHMIEIQAAADVIRHFEEGKGVKIPHHIITLGDQVFAGTSPLTDPDATLDMYRDHDSMAAEIGNRVEKTFVPMRNAVFLMLAANRAVVEGAGVLVTGVCQADNANYPDCRLSFIESAEQTICEALGVLCRVDNGEGDFTLAVPLMDFSKKETVELALQLPYTYSALALSHTAYDGVYPPVGKDHASVLRAHGFEQAGVPDPLVMRAVANGLMPVPVGANYRDYKYDENGEPPSWDAETFAVGWRWQQGYF